ncbi:MAG TPA: NYN domain-containing protein [Planctomycetota bacterium]|nr:NYN domain-containing protein [Planctomycetota bacterium]
MTEARSLAVFIDFENLALGFHGRKARFTITKVLDRLVEKGKIIVKKAYADWTRFGDFKKELHESAIELIEIPKRSMTGKNSADIRLCVDAIDLCYAKEHIDTFVIVSGDSDFSPLVSKLKENGKYVIGLGLKNSTSNLLIDNCDEFIYYEDLERPTGPPPEIAGNIPKEKAQALQLLIETIGALIREGKDVLHASMIKDTMKRKLPSFNESYHGYRSFGEMLEDAEKRGLLRLTTDPRSGTYAVLGFGKEPAKAK